MSISLQMMDHVWDFEEQVTRNGNSCMRFIQPEILVDDVLDVTLLDRSNNHRATRRSAKYVWGNIVLHSMTLHNTVQHSAL